MGFFRVGVFVWIGGVWDVEGVVGRGCCHGGAFCVLTGWLLTVAGYCWREFGIRFWKVLHFISKIELSMRRCK